MWEEEDQLQIKDTSKMIDVAFKIQCKTLPYDHACDLSKAITSKMPWLLQDPLTGIHTLHGPESGNGWVRSEKEEIFLSKRTRLVLRIARSETDKAKKLEGESINVLGNDIKIGKSNTINYIIHLQIYMKWILMLVLYQCYVFRQKQSFFIFTSINIFMPGFFTVYYHFHGQL